MINESLVRHKVYKNNLHCMIMIYDFSLLYATQQRPNLPQILPQLYVVVFSDKIFFQQNFW